MNPTQNPGLWRDARRIFALAVETPVSEREALLERECGGDTAVAAAVRRLLRAHDELDATGGGAAGAIAGALDEWQREPALGAGVAVGEFVVERVLGSGGMGQVYLAQREVDGRAQRVALKVASRRHAGEALLERLRRERRILATLEHPNIARLIDFGEADGRPYYAMEYVDGVSIAAYCAEHDLDLAARARLFLGVCDAVAYAHRRLVLHRDLKPDNVLVDADGRPRLLDFGIAKPLTSTLPAQADLTDDQARFFSPASAAPEQIRGRPTTVATDVYGLGCLLYEMLAGAPPFAPGTRTPLAFQEHILETDAAPASAATHAPAGLAAHLLRGDADAILARCLRKRPEDRYLSVEALADDVRAMIELRPTAVRRGERLYRATRYVRRHRLALGLVAAMALLIVGFVATVLVQARQLRIERDGAVRARAAADAERDRAETIVQFLVESFKNADPARAAGKALTAEDLLTSAARLLPQQLRDQPEAMAAVAQTLAALYFRIERAEPARAQAQVAREVLAKLPDASLRLRLAQVLVDGMEAYVAANFGREVELADAGLALVATAPDDVPIETVYRLLIMKCTAMSAIDPRKSLAEFDRALATLAAAGSPQRWIQAVKVEKARTLANLDRPERLQAKQLLQEVLDWQDATLDPNAVERIVTTALLAKIEERLQDFAGAERHVRDVLVRQTQVYGADSAVVGRSKNLLANVLSATGRVDEADALYHDAMAILVARLGEDDPYAAGLHYNLGLFYLDDAHDRKRAEAEFLVALRLLPKRLGEQHLNVALCHLSYGILLLHEGRYDAAETQIAAATPRLESLGSDDSSYRDVDAAMAVVRLHQGRRDAALALLTPVLPGLRTDRAADDPFRMLVEKTAAGLGLAP